jgi:hypothetical protein
LREIDIQAADLPWPAQDVWEVRKGSSEAPIPRWKRTESMTAGRTVSEAQLLGQSDVLDNTRSWCMIADELFCLTADRQVTLVSRLDRSKFSFQPFYQTRLSQPVLGPSPISSQLVLAIATCLPSNTDGSEPRSISSAAAAQLGSRNHFGQQKLPLFAIIAAFPWTRLCGGEDRRCFRLKKHKLAEGWGSRVGNCQLDFSGFQRTWATRVTGFWQMTKTELQISCCQGRKRRGFGGKEIVKALPRKAEAFGIELLASDSTIDSSIAKNG